MNPQYLDTFFPIFLYNSEILDHGDRGTLGNWDLWGLVALEWMSRSLR